MEYNIIQEKVKEIESLEQEISSINRSSTIYTTNSNRLEDKFLPISSKEIIDTYISNIKKHINTLKQELEGAAPNILTHLETLM